MYAYAAIDTQYKLHVRYVMENQHKYVKHVYRFEHDSVTYLETLYHIYLYVHYIQ